MSIITRQFICAGCLYTYNTNSTQKEMEQEHIARYGHRMKDSDEELVSVCDFCYKEMFNDS